MTNLNSHMTLKKDKELRHRYKNIEDRWEIAIQILKIHYTETAEINVHIKMKITSSYLHCLMEQMFFF